MIYFNMPFQKGHKLAKGRVEGSKNGKTKQWEQFSEWFMSKGMDRLETEIAKLEGKEYVLVVKDMLEYFQPRLSRTEVKGEIIQKIVVKRPSKE